MSTETTNESSVAEEQQKLDLSVNVETLGTCERKIKVTVSEGDIQRYFDLVYDNMIPQAAIPGFRIGKAPRKLIESRFRKEAAEQVKGQLLMDSISQVTDEQKLSAISEPDMDFDSVVIPDNGPMTFEFRLEVRPEFDMPEWKGLSVERPVRDFTAADVDQQLKQILRRHGRLIPHSGAAAIGDYITATITFKQGDILVSTLPEQQLCIRPVLSFRDGKIIDFGKALEGAKAGDTRTANTEISGDAPNENLRGKTISAEFTVLDVKKLEMPELNQQFLRDIGDFANEGELRDFVMEELKRQLTYHQRQRAREQITAALTKNANWELPQELLKKQSVRELQRRVMELKRSGFGDDVIQAHANELRQNAMAITERALKEHFILERLAEEQKIEDDAKDYDEEIALIAQQQGESPRRLRAQLEKRDQMDILRNQIIERKTIDLVLGEAKFKDVPFISERFETEAVDETATGEDTISEEIPDARPASDAGGPAPGMTPIVPKPEE
jgi:trigger factor